MATHEHTINDALAALLRESRRVWRSSDVVRSENTEMLKGKAGRPDILVIEANVSPVVIESESSPAASVESVGLAGRNPCGFDAWVCKRTAANLTYFWARVTREAINRLF